MLTTKSPHIDSSRDVSGMRESAKVKRSHKVRVGDKLLNEYKENPELIGGAMEHSQDYFLLV